MPEQIIQKNRKLVPAADFHFLRQEGLNYIEDLAHDIWSDYNTHDPGITMLEAICYAITELTYRTRFDMKDLLAGENGQLDPAQPFFTPREIFANEPCSLLDYRKLLIDIRGVANAWLYPVQDIANAPVWMQQYGQTEAPLYPDCKKDALTFTPTHHEHTDIRGLYHVRLDLDTTDDFGDLNNGHIDFTLYSSAALNGAKVKCILPRFNQVDFSWLAAYYPIKPQHVTVTPEYDTTGKPARWNITLEYHNDEVVTLFHYDITPALKLPVPDFETLLEDELALPEVQQQIIELYYHKIAYTRSIVQEVWETLHAHRNLCEDWWTIDTISNTPVAICADVEVRPDADIEQVYARIMVAAEQYLNPPVHFYTLKELQRKQMLAADIFEGPRLNNGFLLDEEVAQADLKEQLYVSDLIREIMTMEEVVAVKNVLLTAYDDDGKAILPSQPWRLQLQTDHKPVLDINRSKLTFLKNEVPFHINAGEATDSILYLRGLSQMNKISGTDQDITLPTGRFYELGNYSSLQHDLPETFGTGRASLPDAADAARKAQAKQLKAYLMFYDQLLAGFFSQLQHSKELLGLNMDSKQTYFQQFLHDWEQDKENGIRNIKPIYANAAFLEQVLETPLEDESDAVALARRQLLEDKPAMYERRNRFLDHLIARFAETFNDYVLTLYASRNEASQEELINDKIRFIQDYPETSRRRGTASNILGDIWDTDNISGLQQRIARLVGINNADRRQLFNFPLPEVVEDEDGRFTFMIKDGAGTDYLKPLTPSDTAKQAWLLLNEIYEHMTDSAKYSITEEEDAAAFTLLLADGEGTILATAPNTFDTNIAAAAFKTSILQSLARPADEETLHLVEHFLLRPYFVPEEMPPQSREEVYRLLQVCLPDDCEFCGEEDPYSFRVSVVLPYWPERFVYPGFRQFFERAVRHEAPAHVHVKICWVSYLNIHRLESASNDWLLALQDYRATPQPDADIATALREASNKLVEVMDGLSSVYPEATLHDCIEGTSNPVRLGQTNLGTF